LAQRQLVAIRQQQIEAEVLLHRRAAELRRAVGGDYSGDRAP
jgi:outer membrane protein TolC